MVTISRATHVDLVTRIAKDPGNEVCGIVLRDKHIPMANVHRTPARAYAFDELQQIMVWSDWGGKGDLIIYHSHPAGIAYPSETDIRLAKDPRVYYLIFSIKFSSRFFYRVDAGTVIKEDLNIV